LSSAEEALILTFHSVHAAIRAERMLKARGLSPGLIPVPREIASDCGFCLLLEAGMDGAVDPALECEAVWKRVIETGAEGRRKVYERISTNA